jgi:hypothetical protein
MDRGDMKNAYLHQTFKAYTDNKNPLPRAIINNRLVTKDHLDKLKDKKIRVCEELIEMYCHILTAMGMSNRLAVVLSPTLSKDYDGEDDVDYHDQVALDGNVKCLGETYPCYLLPWMVGTGLRARIDSVIVMYHMSASELPHNKAQGMIYTRHEFVACDTEGQFINSDVTDSQILEVSDSHDVPSCKIDRDCRL